MDRLKPNANVYHPNTLLKEVNVFNRFNKILAVRITKAIGTMWSAYLFAILSIVSLPAILVSINGSLKHLFPSWIIASSMITLIAWISQNFLQLVLLPVIMVGQNVIQGQQDAKADADHKTLTYLANTAEEQIEMIKKLELEIENLKKKI